jgi:chaperonin GroEL (HSP60 family)
MLDEGVVQPVLLTTIAITLASKTIRSILKIDNIVCFECRMIMADL